MKRSEQVRLLATLIVGVAIGAGLFSLLVGTDSPDLPEGTSGSAADPIVRGPELPPGELQSKPGSEATMLPPAPSKGVATAPAAGTPPPRRAPPRSDGRWRPTRDEAVRLAQSHHALASLSVRRRAHVSNAVATGILLELDAFDQLFPNKSATIRTSLVSTAVDWLAPRAVQQAKLAEATPAEKPGGLSRKFLERLVALAADFEREQGIPMRRRFATGRLTKEELARWLTHVNLQLLAAKEELKEVIPIHGGG